MLAVASCVAVSAVPAATAAPELANRTFRLGSIYIITGQHRNVGGVEAAHAGHSSRLHGSWQGRPWVLIAKTEAKRPTGSYRFVVRPKRRGVLRLRLGTPDGGTYRVVITVI